MMTLALEFSSSQRSVALAKEGVVLNEAIETGGRGTAAFSMIERVLAAAKVEREQIEMICVGLGPGSYTGIRAAISIAQGWQLARQTRVAGISSVEALAAQAQSDNIFGQVSVVIDAQRNEFSLAVFEVSQNGWKEIESLKIVPPENISTQAAKDRILVGPGVTRWFPQGRDIFPRASHLVRLVRQHGRAIAVEKLEPIYLREMTFAKAVPLV
ncbi:MAG TPA: tRNA (adenosine(37)-N6)-threonylcarbamoyltransferase complex dimerization subunit type 1 TsaB [Verrucomicrobiae bacterium]|jgi:tRNA threonylcarbamoyladenosine biosynthesis protein TsaB